jgi:hypothetical protein
MRTMSDNEKLAIIKAVAWAMGPGWTANTADCHWFQEMHGPDGVSLLADIAEPWMKRPGRIVFSFQCPDELREVRNQMRESAPRIGVAMVRPADKIAADIKRRLIPDATGYLAALRERKRELDAYETRKAGSLSAIIEALGPAFDGVVSHDGRVCVGKYPNTHGTIRCDSDSAWHLEIDANTDDMVTIATLLSEMAARQAA